MRRLLNRAVVVGILLSSMASYGGAQVGDWPTHLLSPANTATTPVSLGDPLKILWAVPTSEGHHSPLAWRNQSGQHLVISGNFIFNATGGLVATLEDAGDRSAITTVEFGENDSMDILLTGRPRDYFHNSGYEFFAYDLKTCKFLWYLDSADLAVDTYIDINARNGIFYISGVGACNGVVAVDALTGAPIWQKTELNWPLQSTSAYGWIDHVAVAGGKVYFTLYASGLIVLDAITGENEWHKAYNSDGAPPCVDELNHFVYVGTNHYDYALRAFNSESGNPEWTVPIDFILNSSPTLGWANGGQEAVFVVTGGVDDDAGVYAMDRHSGTVLWQTSIPADAWSSAVYSGDSESGSLYIATNDGYTYVLDAMNGTPQRILATDVDVSTGQRCPVIVDTELGGTMYFTTNDHHVEAWNAHGLTEPNGVYEVALWIDPDHIGINSSTTVTAKVIGSDLHGVPGVRISFVCDADKNQGYLSSAMATTGDEGTAAVTFFSQNRTGRIGIGAAAANGPWVYKTVYVDKEVVEEPATGTGTLNGSVYAPNGRKVSGATITATPSTGSVATTTSIKSGRYTLTGLPAGAYTIEGDVADIGHATVEGVNITADTTTTVDLHLQPVP